MGGGEGVETRLRLSREGAMSLTGQRLGWGDPQTQAQKRPAVRRPRHSSVSSSPGLKSRPRSGQDEAWGRGVQKALPHLRFPPGAHLVRTPLPAAGANQSLSGVLAPLATNKDGTGRRGCLTSAIFTDCRPSQVPTNHGTAQGGGGGGPCTPLVLSDTLGPRWDRSPLQPPRPLR